MERQVSAAASGEKDAIVRLPFAGLKVLDLSRVLAGPYCCALLGEAGASVVKVERPGAGDENRRWGHLWHGESLDFMNVNRNKRGITVNLHHPEGQEIIRKLAADADVVVESFVPGTMEKFHLDYESLKPLNPRMVYCSISAFGLQGPLRSKSGYDGALQAFSGHMSITGELEGGPVRTGASIIDMGTGITAYAAVTTALLGRQLSGNGQKVSVSLLQTALSLMGSHAAVSWKAYQRSATATGLYAGVHSGIAEQRCHLIRGQQLVAAGATTSSPTARREQRDCPACYPAMRRGVRRRSAMAFLPDTMHGAQAYILQSAHRRSSLPEPPPKCASRPMKAFKLPTVATRKSVNQTTSDE